MQDQLDGRLARGLRTREAVLDAAVSLASVAGLEGLSLGQLAGKLRVSKSGLFAHWKDKEQLQIEAIEHAGKQWTDQIIRPALHVPRGVRRLFALHENRMAFYASGILPGRCFFNAVLPEFDDRPGAVQAKITEVLTEWMGFVESLARAAITHGDLLPGVDPKQLAFEIEALGRAAATQAGLIGAESAFTFSRTAVLARLRSCSTDPALLPED